MADLALAIAGVVSTGIALTNAVSSFCKSAYKAPQEVKEIESDLRLFHPVLLQVEETFGNPDNGCSPRAERDLQGILDRCHEIFCDIENLLAPYQKPDGTFQAGIGERFKWHFKKEDVRLLGERLEKVKTTLHCMITIINLGCTLSKNRDSPDNKTVPPAVAKSLQVASEFVLGEQSSSANPLLARGRPTGATTNNKEHREKSARVSSWLTELVGFPDEGNSDHSTVQSGKSNVTLSPTQRSITKEATPEVEMLLERWSTLTESKSGVSQSTKKEAQKVSKPSKPNAPQDSREGHTSSSRPIDRASSTPEKSEKKPKKSVNALDPYPSPLIQTAEAKQHPSQLALRGRQTGGPARNSSSVEPVAGPSSTGLNVRPRTGKKQKAGRTSRATAPSRTRKDEDDDLMQALTRITRGSKVNMLNLAGGSPEDKAPSSRVESWINQSEASEPVREETNLEPEPWSPFSPTSNQDFDTRSIFSQASILDNSASETVSVMSRISRILESSDPRRVGMLFHLGNKQFRLKKWSEAAEYYRQAYNIKREEANEDDQLDQEALKIKFKIGTVFGELNKYESAEKTLKGVLSRQKELLGEDHTETQLTRHYYGRVLSRQDKWAEACAVYEPLWEHRKELLNENSTADLAIRTGHELGRILNEIDRFAESTDILGIVHPASKKIRGEIDKVTVSSGVELGKALRCSERQQDAKILLDEIYEQCQQSPTDLEQFSVKCTHELAMLSCHGRNFEEAEKLARSAWVARTAAKGSTDIGTLDSAECLSKALYELGRAEEAHELLKDVYHHLVARFGPEHTRSLVAGKDLGQLLLDRLSDLGKREEIAPAEPPLTEVNNSGVKEQQIARVSHRRKRGKSEGTTTGTIESYLTKRYLRKRYPLARMLLPMNISSQAHQEVTLDGFFNERETQLGIFEEAARENPFLQDLAEAILVVSSTFKGFEAKSNAGRDSMPDAFHFAEQLGPQLLRLIAELEKPSPTTVKKPNVVDGIKLALAQTEKRHASSIYKLIYSGQKGEIGAESERTLATGHEYGCLCVQVNSFEHAEVVLREVWIQRQRILGPNHPQTLESGFQLGQVYFKTDRHDAALSVHESVYGLRRDVFGLQSVQTIQSAEVYGQVLMCRESTDAQMQDGWVLLRQTLEIRKNIFGVNVETITSALRLATISAISGKYEESGEVFTWMFEHGIDSLSPPGQRAHSPGKLAAGLAAAGMAFLARNDSKGNRLLKQISELTAGIYGTESQELRTFSYIQAALFFLQRRGDKSRSILRRIFEMRQASLGRRHPETKAAGIILAMEIFLDTLLSKGKIDQELDEINDWLLDFAPDGGEWTFVMRFCQTAAVVASTYELEGLSKTMLGWLYRTQRRRSGLFTRSTLGTLVLNRGLGMYTMYKRKTKKIPTREGTLRDPRVLMRGVWPAVVHTVANLLARFNQMPFFAEKLPNFLRDSTMWKSFEPTQFTAHFICLFVPVYEELAPPDIGSRIWTIATDDSDTSTIGDMRGHENVGSGSIDFADLDGRASEHLSSLGQSLLNLTLTHPSMSNFSELDAEIEMESLQNELVGEFVTEDGIAAATGDIEILKRDIE